MIELNINDMKDTERHSSKGNQLKWNPANTETWYKADYIGYASGAARPNTSPYPAAC